MCGVPYHAAETYIARLLRSGFKIAVCDQMEPPGPGKKLVRREVVRVITPGTATDLSVLEPKENNFLAAVSRAADGAPIGLAYVDVSTGEFRATEFPGAAAEERLRDELQLLRPREILLPAARAPLPARRALRAPTAASGGVAKASTASKNGFSDATTASACSPSSSASGASKASAWPGTPGHRRGGPCCTTCAKPRPRPDATAQPLLRAIWIRCRYYEQQDALVLDP